MTALVFIALAALAAVHDVLTFAWHRARESGQRGRTILIGVAHELVGAVPLLVALELGTWWPVAAGVLGSIVGSAWSMRAPADR